MNIPFEIPTDWENHFPDSVFSVADYDTIQKTIDACVQAGGGTVLVPSGNWSCGPLHLSSNIHLHLDTNAVITFSDRMEDYLPVVFTRWEGMECYNYSPLIYAKNCHNISITGDGKFVGSGQAWWHWKKLQQDAANELCYAESNHIPVESRVYGTTGAALRPSFIQFVNCQNVIWEDFTIEEGPQWTLHPVYCENVRIKGITVNTTGPNTDGLNPDSCKNVWIEDCDFSTGDDCIAINSGMNEDGWRVAKPCENVVICNCKMRAGHGAIVIGSGMSGGVNNIYATDCHVFGTNQGLRLKSMRGRGGYVKNVWFEHIILDDILEEAVQISMFYPYSTVVPKSNAVPEFSDIHLHDISGTSRKLALEMRGLPELSLKNITLDSVKLTGGIVCDCVENITTHNVTINS